MEDKNVLELLEEAGVILRNDHFVYTSGKHGRVYVNKDAVFSHTKLISRLCFDLAAAFFKDGAEVVIGPAIGGAIIAQLVAHHLSLLTDREILAVYAEKVMPGNGFCLKRDYDQFVVGRKVLVVEDILTTGGSARAVVRTVHACEGYVLGLGVICNRGRVTAEDVETPRIVSLLNLPLEVWDEKDCPLCRDGIPINTEVGHGREFLVRRALSQVAT